MSDIYEFEKKPDSQPVSGTDSSSALQAPPSRSLSPTEAVVLGGFFIMLVLAAIALVSARSGSREQSSREIPESVGTVPTTGEAAKGLLPLLPP